MISTSITERDLEAMLDRHSLHYLMLCLSTVCYAKAEHIASNWQDTATAKAWERAAQAIDRANLSCISI